MVKKSNDLEYIEIPKGEEFGEYITSEKVLLHDYFYTDAKTVKFASDYIPGSTFISMSKFAHMSPKCEKFEVEDDNPYLRSNDGILYSKDMSVLLRCPQEKTGCVRIPEGVKKFACEAFKECKISRVILPKTLNVISTSAFQHSEISSIDFNGSELMIEQSAFSFCSKLTKVILPGGTKFGRNAFAWCDNLKEVILEEGIKAVPYRCFAGCKKLHSISLPKSIEYFGSYSKPGYYFYSENSLIDFDEIIMHGDDIPKGLIYAIATNNIHHLGKPLMLKYRVSTILRFNDGTSICVPKCLSVTKMNMIDSLMPERVSEFSRLDHGCTIMNLYKESSTPTIKLLTALNMCNLEYGTNEELQKYIHRSGKKIIELYLEKDNEHEFIDFIKKGLISKNVMKYAMEPVREKGWTTALAYIMQFTESTHKKSFLL